MSVSRASLPGWLLYLCWILKPDIIFLSQLHTEKAAGLQETLDLCFGTSWVQYNAAESCMDLQHSTDLRVFSLLCGLLTRSNSSFTADSFRLFKLSSSSVRWEGLDFRAETRDHLLRCVTTETGKLFACGRSWMCFSKVKLYQEWDPKSRQVEEEMQSRNKPERKDEEVWNISSLIVVGNVRPLED